MRYLILILFAAGLCQCKKDVSLKLIPTLKPLSYYPIFPGSSWKYIQNDTDTVVHTSSNSYVEHTYLKGYEYDKHGKRSEVYSDPVYIPLLNNSPIYQYNKIECIPPPFGDYNRSWPILSEVVGHQFARQFMDQRYCQCVETVTVHQKTINANSDSIIVLKGRWTQGPNINKNSYQVYTKNIGLSSHFIIDTIAMDTTYKLELFTYHINQ